MHIYMKQKKLYIGEAANYLGKSIDTLRRWDAKGKLVAHRESGGHRYYFESELLAFKQDLFAQALAWVLSGPQEPARDAYCSTSSEFKGRLESLQLVLEKAGFSEERNSLLVAIVGEIGNNSFDHNLGNWPDIIGIYFAFDTNKRQLILADRGRGVLRTLRRVCPRIRNDEEALEVAFTERISGRAPEQRGNGLKFVRSVVESTLMVLNFYSGDACVTIDKKMSIKDQDINYGGCVALINF